MPLHDVRRDQDSDDGAERRLTALHRADVCCRRTHRGSGRAGREPIRSLQEQDAVAGIRQHRYLRPVHLDFRLRAAHHTEIWDPRLVPGVLGYCAAQLRRKRFVLLDLRHDFEAYRRQRRAESFFSFCRGRDCWVWLYLRSVSYRHDQDNPDGRQHVPPRAAVQRGDRLREEALRTARLARFHERPHPFAGSCHARMRLAGRHG
mmetsp:Transcript_33748/g.80422  ORF Transcript_33748/g.80422 Transcript_33748/m.80422 type:complete len:204 (+) Transcript_33748:365-976(+)